MTSRGMRRWRMHGAINCIERYLFSPVCSELLSGSPGGGRPAPRAARPAPRASAIERCSIAKIYNASASSSIGRNIYYAILKNLLR